MIRLEGVAKGYPTPRGWRHVLRDVNLVIPDGVSVGILGLNGQGKSTLLRVIAGIDHPERGTVTRSGRMSWPLGLKGGFQGTLTGRQNAAFICRIHGHWSDIPNRLRFIQAFAEIGDYFDMPVKTYSGGMRSRLAFAVSMAFRFDIYVIDELTSVGDPSFRERCQAVFEDRRNGSSLIMVSHRLRELERLCEAGVVVHGGCARFHPRLDDALAEYEALVQIHRLSRMSA